MSVFCRDSLCGPQSGDVHERGKSSQWSQASGFYFPVLRVREFSNLKFGAGAHTGGLAFCERQQTVVLCPGKQQHCSIMAEHSKSISLCFAVTAVFCSKCSSQLTPSLPKATSMAKACDILNSK